MQNKFATKTITLDYDIVESTIQQLRNEIAEMMDKDEQRQGEAIKNARRTETAILQGKIEAYKHVIAKLRHLQSDINFKQLTKNVSHDE